MILSIGEALIDLIGDQPGPLSEVESFTPFAGGSVSNVAIAISTLGGKSCLAAAIGNDTHGDLISNTLTAAGVRLLLERIEEPTTVVRVSAGRGTPEFEVVRGADRLFDSEVDLKGIDLVHTSAFALSIEPLRSRAMNTLVDAKRTGIRTSIDLNFSPKVWGVEAEAAYPVIAEAVRLCDLVKCSVDDLERVFGSDWHGELLFRWGNPMVILTAGRDHTSIFEGGVRLQDVAVPPAPVIDATGAGDVFWAAFLLAHLDGRSSAEAVGAGHNAAALKLSRRGPLTDLAD